MSTNRKKMDTTDKYRLRIQNCVWTIIDVHSTINSEYEKEEFLSQFIGLDEAIEALDMSLISEGDILMVEQATNALLREFSGLFETGMFRPVYGNALN
jgi:GTP cyclohydrolase III